MVDGDSGSALEGKTVPPKKRRGGPKVRTGCKTYLIYLYRTRRVKCDEAKPECWRCTKSGYDCDGYATPRRQKNLLLPRSHEASSTERTVLVQFPRTGVYIQPSSSPHFDTDMERQYFMIFQTETAPELTGYFDTTVWNRKVLQACHDQEYARHAVVALGAVWKAQAISQAPPNQISLSSGGHQDPMTLYAYALKAYGKAIQLMKDITKQEDPDRLRNTLMSSLLTTCFESYIGNQEFALSQAEYGVDVLLDWGDECQKTPLDDWTSLKRLEHRSTFLDDDIVGVFARMDFQVMTFRDRSRAKYKTKAFPKIPVLFTSIQEARLYWDLIIRRVFIWHAVAHPHGSVTLDFADVNYQLISEGTNPVQKAIDEISDFEEVTKNWYQAFLPIFERTRSCPGTRDHLGASSLMLRYLPARLKLASDLRDYRRLVDLAREILETDGRHAVPGKAIFTFETVVIIGLLVVATSAPEIEVRRQAIALLVKYPRREGLLDSMMVVKVATWMMKQEESEVVEGMIPESSRLRIVKNDFNLKERKAVLHFSKGEDNPLPPVTLWW
ncbi:hypothetical protein N431DRAFT_341648 [Stipitochalara longipes BDJ]|nr:hypothetical protein N431DRAFT_341648 [Stipitochalara longipes BDJ]